MTRAMAVLRRAMNRFKGIKVKHDGEFFIRTKLLIKNHKETRKYSIILNQEYIDAKFELLRLAQLEGYPELYHRLVRGKKPLYAKDKKFQPFMDSTNKNAVWGDKPRYLTHTKRTIRSFYRPKVTSH